MSDSAVANLRTITASPALANGSPIATALKRLGRRVWDPKRYGAVPGVPCGTVFKCRMSASQASVHAPPVAGISTGKWLGNGTACVSICVSSGEQFCATFSPCPLR